MKEELFQTSKKERRTLEKSTSTWPIKSRVDILRFSFSTFPFSFRFVYTQKKKKKKKTNKKKKKKKKKKFKKKNKKKKKKKKNHPTNKNKNYQKATLRKNLKTSLLYISLSTHRVMLLLRERVCLMLMLMFVGFSALLILHFNAYSIAILLGQTALVYSRSDSLSHLKLHNGRANKHKTNSNNSSKYTRKSCFLLVIFFSLHWVFGSFGEEERRRRCCFALSSL